jgi:hypothetical protein
MGRRLQEQHSGCTAASYAVAGRVGCWQSGRDAAAAGMAARVEFAALLGQQ